MTGGQFLVLAILFAIVLALVLLGAWNDERDADELASDRALRRELRRLPLEDDDEAGR